MKSVLRLLRRPLLPFAGLSFFVNLLLVPSIFMQRVFDRVLASQSGETRTPLQYLLEPLTQVLRRAGRSSELRGVLAFAVLAYAGLDTGQAVSPLIFSGMMDQRQFCSVLLGQALMQGV